MSEYRFKHILFTLWNDKFAPLYLDSLINKVGVEPSSVCVVSYGNKNNKTSYSNENVEHLDVEDVSVEIFINAKTITYFSLNSHNSKHIRWMLEISPDIKEKSYMFLTDDEVDRWSNCVTKYGKIIPDRKFFISEDDIWVLNNQTGFFGLEKVFKEKLNFILGERRWNFIDITSVFEILPVFQSESFASAITNNIHDKKTILFGTKPSAFKYDEIRSLIKLFVRYGHYGSFRIIIMWPVSQWRKRLALELYFLYLHKVKGVTLDVSILTPLSSLAYNAIVSSCTHLLLQPRGGGGAARLFLKLGLGKVCTFKGGHNDRFFSEAQAVDLVQYSSFKELIENLDREVDIQGNAFKISREEERSVKELAKFYS